MSVGYSDKECFGSLRAPSAWGDARSHPGVLPRNGLRRLPARRVFATTAPVYLRGATHVLVWQSFGLSGRVVDGTTTRGSQRGSTSVACKVARATHIRAAPWPPGAFPRRGRSAETGGRR